MEKRTRVRIVAVLYLTLGVFYIVLGWNAKLWYPNMFASPYWNEGNATTGTKIIAIFAGVWQLLIGSCLLQSKHYGLAQGLSGILMFACLLFSFVFAGEDDSEVPPINMDLLWFFGYLILLAAHLLFWIFIAMGGKPKAGLGKVRLVRAHWQSRDTCIFWQRHTRVWLIKP